MTGGVKDFEKILLIKGHLKKKTLRLILNKMTGDLAEGPVPHLLG